MIKKVKKILTKKEIPLEIRELQEDSYHVFLKAKINGKVMRMLLDTGASKTVVDKTFVETKLKTSKVKDSNNPTSSLHATVSTSSIMTAKSIEIGTVKIENYVVAVLDLTHVNQTYDSVKCKPIQGILGSDILVDKNAVIDYSKKTMKLKS
jgi:predicted aspartyl protease